MTEKAATCRACRWRRARRCPPPGRPGTAPSPPRRDHWCRRTPPSTSTPASPAGYRSASGDLARRVVRPPLPRRWPAARDPAAEHEQVDARVLERLRPPSPGSACTKTSTLRSRAAPERPRARSCHRPRITVVHRGDQLRRPGPRCGACSRSPPSTRVWITEGGRGREPPRSSALAAQRRPAPGGPAAGCARRCPSSIARSRRDEFAVLVQPREQQATAFCRAPSMLIPLNRHRRRSSASRGRPARASIDCRPREGQGSRRLPLMPGTWTIERRPGGRERNTFNDTGGTWTELRSQLRPPGEGERGRRVPP